MDRLTRLSGLCGLALALATAAGCSYQGESLNNPVVRRATWFSFVAGEDIRDRCGKGGPDRYRLVYNGFWHEQVRIYELGTPEVSNLLKQRVLGGASISYFTSGDWASPWRGKTAEARLTPEQYDGLIGAMTSSGMFGPPPVGLRLPSDGYYWTAVGCRGGRFYFNAWLFPDERFRRLIFPKALMAVDGTNVPLNDPDPASQILHYTSKELQDERWYIQVHEDGFST